MAIPKTSATVTQIIQDTLVSIITAAAATFRSALGLGSAAVEDVADITGTVPGLHYDATITGLTGGGATKLDGIATTSLAAGRVQLVFTSGVECYLYKLTTSTATELSPYRIRPDDYDAGTNVKCWELCRPVVESLGVAARSAAFVSYLENISGTAERNIEMPDADGELNITP